MTLCARGDSRAGGRPRVAPRTLIAIADAIRAGAKKAAYASGRALPKFTRLSLARSDRDFAKQKAALMRAFRRLALDEGKGARTATWIIKPLAKGGGRGISVLDGATLLSAVPVFGKASQIVQLYQDLQNGPVACN